MRFLKQISLIFILAAQTFAAEVGKEGGLQEVIGRLPLKLHRDNFDRLYTDYEVGITAQYGQFYPRAPIFHPYEPNGSQLPKYNAGLLTSSVRLLYPKEFHPDILECVQAITGPISQSNLQIYFITQDLPWNNKESVLYRPHYWLDPAAPFAGHHNTLFATAIQFFKVPQGNTITANSSVMRESFSVHEGGRYVVSSPSNCAVDRFLKREKNESLALFSLAQHQGRTALTLHWLLNERDQQTLQSKVSGLLGKEGYNLSLLQEALIECESLRQLYHF